MIFSASCIYPDILCIIYCRQSKSVIISRDHGHPYELPDLWPCNSPDLIQLTTKSGAACLVYQTKMQNVNDLRQHLFDARAGVEQSIIDDGIDQ